MDNRKSRVANYLARLSDSTYGVPAPISGAVNYLLDSYFAKVDYRNSLLSAPPRIPADPECELKEAWLGCELFKAVTLNRSYPRFAKSLNAYALSRMFEGNTSKYEIVPFLETYEHKDMLRGSYYWRIQSESIRIAPEKRVTLPVFGNFFIRHRATGKNLFMTIDLGYESVGCSIAIMASPDCQSAAEEFFADFGISLIAHDIYYKKCTTFVCGQLDFAKVSHNTWNDVVLKDHIKAQIQSNSVSILDHNETLTSLGMCPNRNVILISPPGMAKTTIFRAVSHEVEGRISRIWCTGKSIDRADDVTALFEAARSLAPCIIFIEDMDLFGGDRSTNGESRVLNEFLACLDGAQENSGVVVMASTNDISSMDEALVNRPGRFDEKVEIPLPDREDRSIMLRNFFRKFSARPDSTVNSDIWGTVIELTNGLTGAYLKDLAKSTIVQSVTRGAASEGSVTFSSEDLLSAAQKVMANYQIGKRAKKHHQFEPDADKPVPALFASSFSRKSRTNHTP